MDDKEYQDLFELIQQEFDVSALHDQIYQVVMESKKILDKWKKQGYD